MKERYSDGDTSTAIQWLRYDLRLVQVPQFLAVVLFVCTRHDKHLSIDTKQRFEPNPCLSEEAPSTKKGTKLFRPGVARDLSR
jgi:hypothetical protein